MDASDILDSDQRIMAQTTVRNGVLSFNFGDGHAPLQGRMDGVLNSKQIIQWCNAVRGEYNARKDRKENQEDRPAADVRSPPEREDAPAPVSSGGGLPVETSIEGAKASLVRWIESSLAEVGRQRADVGREITECYSRLEKLEDLDKQLAEAERYHHKTKETICGT